MISFTTLLHAYLVVSIYGYGERSLVTGKIEKIVENYQALSLSKQFNFSQTPSLVQSQKLSKTARYYALVRVDKVYSGNRFIQNTVILLPFHTNRIVRTNPFFDSAAWQVWHVVIEPDPQIGERVLTWVVRDNDFLIARTLRENIFTEFPILPLFPLLESRKGKYATEYAGKTSSQDEWRTDLLKSVDPGFPKNCDLKDLMQDESSSKAWLIYKMAIRFEFNQEDKLREYLSSEHPKLFNFLNIDKALVKNNETWMYNSKRASNFKKILLNLPPDDSETLLFNYLYSEKNYDVLEAYLKKVLLDKEFISDERQLRAAMVYSLDKLKTEDKTKSFTDFMNACKNSPSIYISTAAKNCLKKMKTNDYAP